MHSPDVAPRSLVSCRQRVLHVDLAELATRIDPRGFITCIKLCVSFFFAVVTLNTNVKYSVFQLAIPSWKMLMKKL